jgi:protein-disulfide isomerase
MDKRFGLIVLAVVSMIVGIFYFTSDNSNTGESSVASGTVSNHSKGTGTVELIEYGDFQCPACGQFYPLVEEVVKKYEGKLKFTFKHFPIDSIHPNARAAHRSAEAAGLQGKFFEMYDELYKNLSTWTGLSNPIPTFEGYASSLGLDMTKFKTDFASATVNATINADLSEGKTKYKVDATPTFVLNGEVLDNAEIGTIDDFSKKIDASLGTK